MKEAVRPSDEDPRRRRRTERGAGCGDRLRRRLEELERENQRLRREVFELMLDKQMLTEAIRGSL